MKHLLLSIIIASVTFFSINRVQAQCYSAVQLDGTNQYLHTPFSNYNFSDFTIEMWIKSADFSPNDIYVSLNINSYIALGGWATDGSFNTWAEGLNPNSINSGNGTTPTVNTWHHIAFVYDGSHQIIYIDGSAVQTTPTSSTVLQGNGQTYGLAIGARFDGTQQYTNTAFDDVRIWGTARTSAELNANMNSSLTGSESGLFAYYRFEDGAGSSTITDLTGNGNTLTMNNMDPQTDWITGLFSTSIQSTDVIENCGPLTWIDGNTYSTNNNTAVHTIIGGAAGGCDSIVTLNLTVNALPDISLTTNISDITSNETGLGTQYQWLDCNNGSVTIPGEMNQTFTATNGYYAVIITEANGCSDTSVCVNIGGAIGIDTQTTIQNLSLYPNPVNSTLTIDSDEKIETIEIVNIMGKTIENITNSNNTINVSNLTSGIYFLQIQTDKGLISTKFIKK